MAPQNQPERSFDPSRDVAGMSDGFLRDHGLNGRGSIPFFRDLARLVPAGQCELRFASWTALSDVLIRLRAGDHRGLRQKNRIDEKLNQLRKQGLLGGADYELEFLPPDRWRPRTVSQREPELRFVEAMERQASLFGRPEDATFGVFRGDETGSGSGFQETGFPGKPDPDPVSSTSEHTSYPCARAVESIVEDESTGSRSNFEEISEEELAEAQHAWRQTIARWRARKVSHRIDGEHGRRNVAAWLKAHVLVQRGQLSESVFAAASEAPLLAERIRKGPFALVWAEWKRDATFGRKIARLRLPADWAVGIRRSDAAPNGEEPQRE